MPETEPSSEFTALDMGQARRCTACGAALTGPFESELKLVRTVPGQEPQQEVTVTARAWVCPGCGLAHWYAQEQDLDKLVIGAGIEGELAPKPGSSYERRMQVLQALRRVRRM